MRCFATKRPFLPFNEQVKAFQRILAEFPKSEFADKVNGYLAEVFLSSKEYEHSLSVIQKIANPDQETAARPKASCYFLLGVDRYNNSRFQEATNLFSQSIQPYPRNLTLSSNGVLFLEGRSQIPAQRPERAPSLDYKRFA